MFPSSDKQKLVIFNSRPCTLEVILPIPVIVINISTELHNRFAPAHHAEVLMQAGDQSILTTEPALAKDSVCLPPCDYDCPIMNVPQRACPIFLPAYRLVVHYKY